MRCVCTSFHDITLSCFIYQTNLVEPEFKKNPINSELVEKKKCGSINFKQVEHNLPLRICSDRKLSCPRTDYTNRQKFSRKELPCLRMASWTALRHKNAWKKIISCSRNASVLVSVRIVIQIKMKGRSLFLVSKTMLMVGNDNRILPKRAELWFISFCHDQYLSVPNEPYIDW